MEQKIKKTDSGVDLRALSARYTKERSVYTKGKEGRD